MTRETPVSSDARGLPPTVDQRGIEAPGSYPLVFEPPSQATRELLSFRVINGIEDHVRLARVPLPDQYPYTDVRVDFRSWKFENSPYWDAPKHETGYDLVISAALRQPAEIDEETARKMLLELQTEGEYTQLSNGHHQLVIPGSKRAFDRYQRPPYRVGETTAVMQLGVQDLNRGLVTLQRRRSATDSISERDRFNRRIVRLRAEAGKGLTHIRATLASNFRLSSGVDAGTYVELSGRKGEFFVADAHILPFLEKASDLLVVAARGLGAAELPQVNVPVEVSKSARRNWEARNA